MSRLAASLVRTYPPDFQRRFGAEMAQVLGDVACDRRRTTAPERMVRDLRILADILVSAGWEWWNLLAATTPARPASSAWARLRSASPQRTAEPEPLPFATLPRLRRLHAGRALPPRAPSMI